MGFFIHKINNFTLRQMVKYDPNDDDDDEMDIF